MPWFRIPLAFTLWVFVSSCLSLNKGVDSGTVASTSTRATLSGKISKGVAQQIQRKPYVGVFQLDGWNDPVMFIGAHSRPDAAIEEAQAIGAMDLELRSNNNIEHSVILGDLNLGCKYATPTQIDSLNMRRLKHYLWLTDDKSDSAVSDKETCAYDRIIVNGKIQAGAKPSRVMNDVPKISDHYPIASELQNLVIGTFNLQRYGNSKASDDTYLKQLGEVICRFDLILLVELVGKDEKPFAQITPAAERACNRSYKISFSELTGSDTYKERFAYVYDSSKVQLQRAFLVGGD